MEYCWQVGLCGLCDADYDYQEIDWAAVTPAAGGHRLVGARAGSHKAEAPFVVAINPWA